MPDIDNPVSPVPVHIEERKSPGSPHSPSATHSRHPHHHSPSSQGSTPSPSNLSHPASLNGDDARHGTSPATSVDVPSVPPAGLKLDTASHYAQTRREQQASLSRAGVARSPHPLDGTFTGRSGGMLATMQEEGGPSFADSRRDSSLGFDSNQTFSQMEQAMRASRHRSASSAAALALHGSSGPHVDRWSSNAAGRIAPASNLPSRALWDGARTGEAAGGPNAPNSMAAQRPQPHLQRGFSASYVRNKPEPASPSPFLSSPAGFHDLGFDFTEGSLRTHRSNYNTNSSPFGAVHDLPELSSYPEPTRLGGADADGLDGDDDRAQSGYESRRHSVAGPTIARRDSASAGVIGGHRRAIGFDVAGPYTTDRSGHELAGHGTTTDRGWPVAGRHGRDRSITSVSASAAGFNPFAGGSLALSLDDLAGDSDFEPSSHARTPRRDLSGTRATADPTRVSGTSAPNVGPHAASMPSAFDEGSLDGFGAGSDRFADAPRLTRAGLDSLSASWDTMAPSHMAARSPGEGQHTFAEMTRRLRQMSIGEQDVHSHSHRHGSNASSFFDSQAEGTRTVRASPGTSPTGVRGLAAPATGHALSAQAKSFTASQPTAGYGQDFAGALSGAAMGAHGMPAGYGFAPPGSVLAPGSRMPYPPPTASPFGMMQQSAFGPGPGPALGMSGPAPLPALSPNDLTFSSLAALGPMPPSSMGPPGALGGSGAPFGLGASGDLQDLGKGVPLGSLSKDTPLYIVEFKQGRTDLFFRSHSPTQSPSMREEEPIRRGDLVIVEADRGKDLGTVVNDSITVEQVQAFLAHQSDLTIGAAAALQGNGSTALGAGSSRDETSSNASGRSGSPSASSAASGPSSSATSNAMASRPMRTINPKRLFTKATAADTSTLYSKAQDEERALQLCISKVMQRGLPMSVVAAEMQWDRRKLTFYYTASMRVDFRDLVKELFRLYKTRIWMCHLGHPSGTGLS